MDRAVRLPGLRALDRNFDRLPESLRWLVERIVHDPRAGEVGASPSSRPSSASWLRDALPRDVGDSSGAHGPSLRLAGLEVSASRLPREPRHVPRREDIRLLATKHRRPPDPGVVGLGHWPAERLRRTHAGSQSARRACALRRSPAARHAKLRPCGFSLGRRASGSPRSSSRSFAAAVTSRSRTARSPKTSATTGPGPARRLRETWRRDAPSRGSSAAGPAPAPRSPPTRSPGVRAALCVDADTAAGARKWNDANVLALSLRAHLRSRARRDPRRLVRGRAQRRPARSRERGPPVRDRA